jgi:glutamyl-Q tRNA(Asp) synthetase
MRIEDVDTPRVVEGSAEQILRDLEAFGFEWDGEVLYQSRHFDHYQHHLDRLLEQGHCFACECSRKTLREQAVKHGPLGQIYPSNCRNKRLAIKMRTIRLDIGDAASIKFDDQVYGVFALNLPDLVGDFVVKRVDGIYAYHLAVVIDDYLQGINEIVRGADLLENTCLHIYLQQQLGFASPKYMHIPLAMNAQGIKLSKQTGATALNYRQAPQLMIAALQHLGQAPEDNLKQAVPSEILHWAVNHWHRESIPRTRPTTAETFEN